jgi:hypothetical protein
LEIRAVLQTTGTAADGEQQQQHHHAGVDETSLPLPRLVVLCSGSRPVYVSPGWWAIAGGHGGEAALLARRAEEVVTGGDGGATNNPIRLSDLSARHRARTRLLL